MVTNTRIKTPMWFIGRDTVMCAIVAVFFIAVWAIGQMIGNYDGFIPFFFDGVFTVVGFIGTLAALAWMIFPLTVRQQIFPSFYN